MADFSTWSRENLESVAGELLDVVKTSDKAIKMIERSEAWILLSTTGDGKLETLSSRSVEKWALVFQELLQQIEPSQKKEVLSE